MNMESTTESNHPTSSGEDEKHKDPRIGILTARALLLNQKENKSPKEEQMLRGIYMLIKLYKNLESRNYVVADGKWNRKNRLRELRERRSQRASPYGLNKRLGHYTF